MSSHRHLIPFGPAPTIISTLVSIKIQTSPPPTTSRYTNKPGKPQNQTHSCRTNQSKEKRKEKSTTQKQMTFVNIGSLGFFPICIFLPPLASTLMVHYYQPYFCTWFGIYKGWFTFPGVHSNNDIEYIGTLPLLHIEIHIHIHMTSRHIRTRVTNTK